MWAGFDPDLLKTVWIKSEQQSDRVYFVESLDFRANSFLIQTLHYHSNTGVATSWMQFHPGFWCPLVPEHWTPDWYSGQVLLNSLFKIKVHEPVLHVYYLYIFFSREHSILSLSTLTPPLLRSSLYGHLTKRQVQYLNSYSWLKDFFMALYIS